MAQWLRLSAPNTPNTGGPGSIPGQGTSTFDPSSGKILHATEQLSCVPQRLSLCSTAQELQLLKPECRRARALQ